MDVSRIEAVSPRQIDWRKLTANEIIKYDTQGVSVPPEYLQWAKEFRQDLAANDKDDTTYEKAQAAQNTLTATENAPVDNTSADENSTGDDIEAPVEEKSAAQSKREALENAGVSLRTQAKIFTADSKEASRSVLQSAAAIMDAQELSNNEIQALDSYMQELLSKAGAVQNELKSEVNNINNNKNDASAIGKINKLQQQLERYGNEGQMNIASAEGDFNVYESSINAQSGAILNAQDFGSESIGVGNDLLTSIKGAYLFRLRDFIAGRRAVKSGERAVGLSELTAGVQTQASSVNTDNKSAAASYKNQVENTTGVGGISLAKNDANASGDGQNTEADKSTETAGITETDKAASANLDQVLQAKIRKGENLNT